MRSKLVPGEVVSGESICTDEEVLSSEYYHDFFRLQDFFYPFAGCVQRDGGSLVLLQFIHPRSAGPCSDAEASLLKLLMPHFRRSVKLQTLIGASYTALESIGAAVALANRAGKILFANRAARHIFEQRDGFSLESGGNLRCDGQTRNRLLKLMYESGECADGRGLNAGGVVPVPRPSGKRAYSVTISPIRYTLPALGTDRPTVILLISDPEAEPEGLESAARRIYDLTPSEARLARILADGKSLNDACGELHIQRTTARTHLRNLFDKLGVKRQAELVSLLLRSAA